ncbi:MAG: peptidylprolyl isomerase, partial [Elainella sp.]
MAQAKSGDTVTVHYTGTLDDGTVFDSSEGGEPLEFAIGAGNVIPGFEQAVIGMSPGDSKTATIPSDEAYGPYFEDRVLVVERQQIPADLPVDVG